MIIAIEQSNNDVAQVKLFFIRKYFIWIAAVFLSKTYFREENVIRKKLLKLKRWTVYWLVLKRSPNDQFKALCVSADGIWMTGEKLVSWGGCICVFVYS